MPDNWNIGTFGTNNAVFTYPVAGQQGAKGASVDISTYTDGDGKWYFNDVAVTPGTAYNFSDYYKSTVATTVTARYTVNSASGTTFVYVDLGYPAASADWTQFSSTITPPAGTTSLTVFHLLSAAGSLSVDNFSLALPGGPGDPNAFDKGYVSLTFDDGVMSHYTTVLPMLNTAGLKGSFYIITGTGATGGDGAGDLNDPQANISYAQVHSLADAGQEIGAHTRTHPSLTTNITETNDHILTNAERIAEIQGSRNDLLGQGFTPVNTFVYPYGDFDANVQGMVQGAGYTGARSVLPGYNMKNTDKYALQVQNVLNTSTAAEIKGWIDTAAANHTWLILVVHHVDDTNDQYGTTPAIMQEVVDYLVAQQTPVITMGQGLVMMP